MNFIDFLEDCKINNKELEFRDNRFMIGDKTYFFVEQEKKYINTVLDSERQPTKYTLWKFEKNSSEWSIEGSSDVAVSKFSKKLNRDLTGRRISIKDGKVEFYFRKLTVMEEWSYGTRSAANNFTLLFGPIGFFGIFVLAFLVYGSI